MVKLTGSNPPRTLKILKLSKKVNDNRGPILMGFESRTSLFTSGEGNVTIDRDFGSVKILRHRRGSNTRSSLYESDALPLGHCALIPRRNFVDRIVQTIVLTSAIFQKPIYEVLLLSRVGFL